MLSTLKTWTQYLFSFITDPTVENVVERTPEVTSEVTSETMPELEDVIEDAPYVSECIQDVPYEEEDDLEWGKTNYDQYPDESDYSNGDESDDSDGDDEYDGLEMYNGKVYFVRTLTNMNEWIKLRNKYDDYMLNVINPNTENELLVAMYRRN